MYYVSFAKKFPFSYDWIGALICLAVVSVMLFAPRSS
ncbi:hypothetical protein [Bacillus sp. FSL K6-2860]